ncbi:hypothetical protein FA13DRAFT_1820432 [Coprinellus micaceus]|uniref:Peptidase C14 caspase domain-containing protein n=1 Tax=Coprinellus micaceus TaxID=71717 RepID=A0A4Y7SES1_COPMI|nr:hypothetical protein FA13DRAFT_1820432 [Coprinellus micaceus]
MVIPIYDDADVALMGPTVAPHDTGSSPLHAHPGRPPARVQSPERTQPHQRPPRTLHKPSHSAGQIDSFTPAYQHPSPITPLFDDADLLQPPPRPGTQQIRPSSSSPALNSSSRPPLSPTRTSSGNQILLRMKERHEAFHAAIRNYFKVLPPSPHVCRSHCSGRKRAVCIGINYIGQKHELQGCANDARNMREFLIRTSSPPPRSLKHILIRVKSFIPSPSVAFECTHPTHADAEKYHFPPTEILLLTDDDRRNRTPTREEMFKAMAWLVDDAKQDDSLFFHYSGHGGQVPNEDGRELDGMDENIFPVDAADAGDIIDDDLHTALVEPLPPGCRLSAVFDSCHSGTILDLPYLHSAHGRLRSVSHITKRVRKRGALDTADVICFSACKDDETSADTFNGSAAVGAMSYAFIRALEQDPHQTYDELLTHLRETLIPKYQQKAQISCTLPIELERQFTL